jgi:transcriptional regulator with XRE-family HTH domain
LNLTENYPPCKEAARYRPTHEEGLYIQFRLKAKKHSFVHIAESLGVAPQTVANIVLGKRRSKRIESEIARILGKADWNEVVLEARSEVQKKPVEVILNEMRLTEHELSNADLEQFENHRTENWEQAGEVWRKGKALIEEKKKNRAKRRVTA